MFEKETSRLDSKTYQGTVNEKLPESEMQMPEKQKVITSQ